MSTSFASVKSINPCQSVIQTAAERLHHGCGGLQDYTDAGASTNILSDSVKSNNPCQSVMQTTPEHLHRGCGGLQDFTDAGASTNILSDSVKSINPCQSVIQTLPLCDVNHTSNAHPAVQ